MIAALVDGRPAQSLPLDDRALHYGDGVFETIRMHGPQPRAWAVHMARLGAGCQRLGLGSLPAAVLLGDLARLAPGATDWVAKVILSRAPGPRGYRPGSVLAPRRVVLAYPDPADQSEPVTLQLCRTLLAGPPRLAGLKHLNCLGLILASAELPAGDDQVGLLREPSGAIVCATGANLFWVRNGRLETPALAIAGVAGVTRARIIAQARRLGLRRGIGTFGLAALLAADEAFICNAVRGIRPVGMLHWVTPSGTRTRHWSPGPFADRLSAGLRVESSDPHGRVPWPC